MSGLLFFPGYYRNLISQVATYLWFFEKLFMAENENNYNFLMSSINRGVQNGDKQPNLFIMMLDFPRLVPTAGAVGRSLIVFHNLFLIVSFLPVIQQLRCVRSSLQTMGTVNTQNNMREFTIIPAPTIITMWHWDNDGSWQYLHSCCHCCPSLTVPQMTPVEMSHSSWLLTSVDWILSRQPQLWAITRKTTCSEGNSLEL